MRKVVGVEFGGARGGTGRRTPRQSQGAENVRRREAALPELRQHRDECFVVAYGDSRGDREMLDFADEGHYKPFDNP